MMEFLVRVFHKWMPPEAIDLASRLLHYSPSLRCTALETCAHPFFDELRVPNARLPNGGPFPLPNGGPFPPLFDFKQEVCFLTIFVAFCNNITIFLALLYVEKISECPCVSLYVIA